MTRIYRGLHYPHDCLLSIILAWSVDLMVSYVCDNLIKTLKIVSEKQNDKFLETLNYTSKKINYENVCDSNEIRDRAISVFGPFMKKYNFDFPINWENVNIPLISIIRFNIFGVIRKVNEWNFKKHTKRKSIPGTIYGDMQRKRTKD